MLRKQETMLEAVLPTPASVPGRPLEPPPESEFGGPKRSHKNPSFRDTLLEGFAPLRTVQFDSICASPSDFIQIRVVETVNVLFAHMCSHALAAKGLVLVWYMYYGFDMHACMHITQCMHACMHAYT